MRTPITTTEFAHDGTRTTHHHHGRRTGRRDSLPLDGRSLGTVGRTFRRTTRPPPSWLAGESTGLQDSGARLRRAETLSAQEARRGRRNRHPAEAVARRQPAPAARHHPHAHLRRRRASRAGARPGRLRVSGATLQEPVRDCGPHHRQPLVGPGVLRPEDARREEGDSMSAPRANPPATVTPKKRCAVYTRKSTDEGLDQEYNSLEAQRDAGLAFIASQRHEGWLAIGDGDGGYSGGNMERPALRRLMADIETGKIDTVVVYKIDRLTRSLPDFAKLVEVFDRNRVSSVSVTQQFNTTTSMGRLTLNILLSFAQFEREVTGERIRDKIAASKAKGMWMGGVPPLGYDVVERKLIVVEEHAVLVRDIFARYLQVGNVRRVADQLAADGVMRPLRTTSGGRQRPGRTIDQQYLFTMLRNRIYLGEISHNGQWYEGQHEAITTPAL